MGRQRTKVVAIGRGDLCVTHNREVRRRRIKTHHRGKRVGVVQNLHAAIVGDHDFADEAELFFHQGHAKAGAVAQIKTDLGTANTDGRHRCIQGHRVGVGLRNLTGHERKHALQCGDRDRTFLRARIVDHFVQHHAAFGAHRERRIVRQKHTNAAVVTGFQNVALEHLVAGLQLNARTVDADRPDFAFQVFDFTDRLTVGAGDHRRAAGGITALLGSLHDFGLFRLHKAKARLPFRRRCGIATGQRLDHIAPDLGAICGNQLGRVRIVGIPLDRDGGTVRESHHQIAPDHAEFSIGKRKIFRNLNIARLRPIGLERFVSDLCGISHFFTTL